MTKWDVRIRYLSLVILSSTALYILSRTPSCGIEDPPSPPSPNVSPLLPPKDCGDVKLGGVRKTTCPDGKSQKIEACTEAGLVTALDCEKPKGTDCGKTTYAEVKQVISSKCVSCHPGWDSFQVVSSRASKIVTRVTLSPGDPQRMPKAPSQPLSDEEKDLLKKWQLDGFLEACPGKSQPQEASINFDQIESAIIDNLNSLNEEDRQNSRFLVLSHKINENVTPADFGTFQQASDKVVNSISSRARKLEKLSIFGPNNSLMRIDLNRFELTKNDWDKIIANDPLKIESFTNKGKIIKFLTQNARPWMHFDNFIDVTNGNANVYYDLLGVPATFGELTKNLGVNYAGDFLNFRAMLIGTNKSPISLQKNRLISRHDSLDDYFWVTYDTVALGGVKQRNLFEFPLLKETGGKAVFDFAAGEVIFTLPNQLQGYALFNNKGQRQNAAPLNVVTDVSSPITPEIKVGISCHRCHAAGLIPAIDEIRSHVLQNASQFLSEDVQIVKALYRVDSVNQSQFKTDDARFLKALGDIGVSSGIDPINFASDRFLLQWDLAQTAAFLFLKKADFAELLNQSATGRAQVGQLLSGGHITHDQFIQVLPQLIKDLRLFQEQLGG